MPAQSVLVTGASGLIGQQVALSLRRQGIPVVATDAVVAPDSATNVVTCDLRDRDRLEDISREGLSAIVHCGGFSGPMVGGSTPQLLLDVNVGGTANLLELGRRHGIQRFVFASTATVYGATIGDLVDEAVLPRPANVYAASKLAAEQLVNAYSDWFSGGAYNLRLAWVYGPRRTTECVIRTMITDALSGITTEFDFGAGFPRQFMHVDDAARALVLALSADHPKLLAYNITGEQRTDLDDVASIVRDVLPNAQITMAAGKDPLDVEQALFHTTAARRDLGFIPEISLRDGIASYAEWLSTRAEYGPTHQPEGAPL